MGISQAVRKRILFFTYLAIFALVCIWPAIYNGFPLVNSDSGSYIGGAYHWQPAIDRAKLYSFFILFTGVGISLWFTVVAQAGLLFFLIKLFFSKVLLLDWLNPKRFFVILLLIALSSAPWFISQINPDIFTGYFLLSLLIIVFGVKDGGYKKWLWLLLAVCLLVHNVNMLLAIILGLFFALVYFKNHVKRGFFLKLSAFGLGAFLLTCSYNLSAGYGFTANPVSYLFITSRFAENGMLKKFLDENCQTKNYILCETKEQIGGRQWDFMWNYDDFPHKGMDHWLDEDLKFSYKEILKDMLAKSEFQKLFVFESMKGTFQQLKLLNIDDGFQGLGEGSSPYTAISEHYPTQLSAYSQSKQTLWKLSLQYVNVFVTWFSLLVFLLPLSYSTAKRKCSSFIWSSTLVMVAFLLLQAFLCATLSTYLGRYEARFVWVLPLVAFCGAWYYHPSKRLEENGSQVI